MNLSHIPYLHKIIRPNEKIILNLIAVLVGLATGLSAVIIHFLIDNFSELFYGESSPLKGFINAPFWKIALVLFTIGALVGIVINYFSKESQGHGVPEVMYAILIKKAFIKPSVAFYKMVTSALSIAAGGAVGSEGPIAQVGGTLGSTIGRKLVKKELFLKTLVAAGAGSGIAAAFNAPMAGALFAAEVILGDFSIMAFSPIIIATATSTLVALQFLGQRSFFHIPEYVFNNPMEFLLFAALGVVTGCVALLFIWTLYYFERIMGQPLKVGIKKLPNFLKPAFIGIIIALIGAGLPYILGSGFETIELVLNNHFTIWMLFLLLFGKLIATSLTLGSGFSGGVFAPSLFLGAITGILFGSLVTTLFNIDIPIAIWGVLGMAGSVAGSIQGPITATLIIFEMTQNFYLLFPLMLTAMISSVITMMIKRESIYTQKLKLRGINMRKSEQEDQLKNETVKNYIVTPMIHFEAGTHLNKVIKGFFQSEQQIFPVVNNSNEMKLVGIISMDTLKYIFEDQDDSPVNQILIANDLMEAPISIDQNETILDAIKIFANCDHSILPVTTYQGYLVGLLKEHSILSIYQSEHQKRTLAKSILQRKKIHSPLEGISIGDSIYIHEILAPKFTHNKSLIDLDFRNKFDLEIILIYRDGGDRVFPLGSCIINPGDHLTILGKGEQVKDFMEQCKKEEINLLS